MKSGIAVAFWRTSDAKVGLCKPIMAFLYTYYWEFTKSRNETRLSYASLWNLQTSMYVCVCVYECMQPRVNVRTGYTYECICLFVYVGVFCQDSARNITIYTTTPPRLYSPAQSTAHWVTDIKTHRSRKSISANPRAIHSAIFPNLYEGVPRNKASLFFLRHKLNWIRSIRLSHTFVWSFTVLLLEQWKWHSVMRRCQCQINSVQ
jgi:hypothetical protein